MAHFEKIAERSIHDGYFLQLVERTFRAPGGEEFSREMLDQPGAVAIVPIIPGAAGPEVVCVRQFRGTVEREILEIPAGMRDKPGEDLVETAARELAEEVGLAAENYELLTTFYGSAGTTNHQTAVFLATGLSEVGTNFDGVEEQYMTVEHIPLASWPELLAAGELCDAKTQLGFVLASRVLNA